MRPVSKKAVKILEELIPRNGKLKIIQPSKTLYLPPLPLCISLCRLILSATPLSWWQLAVPHLLIADPVT